MSLRNPSSMAQLIDMAQRLRIIRRAQREFLRLWASENPKITERFEQASHQPKEISLLRSRWVYDDE